MHRTPAACLLFVLSLATAAPAQDLVFEHISVEQGLSRAWVTALLKDRRGFVWMGTASGLNRYDGQRVVSSLGNTYVRRLFEDRKGRLWVGSQKLELYDRERDRFVAVPLSEDDHPADVNAIVEDPAGSLWVGTVDALVRLDPETRAFQRYACAGQPSAALELPSIKDLAVDSRGRLWAASDVGVARIDTATRAVSRVAGTAGPAENLHVGERGLVWASGRSNYGLLSIEPESGRVTRYLPDAVRPGTIGTRRVNVLASDGRGRLFAGTENGGLEVLDLATQRFRRYLPRRGDDRSIAGSSIYSLLYDDQGILWVGTYNGGVSLTSAAQGRFGLLQARREDELSDPHVSAVVQDRGGVLWVGTDGGGLNRLAPGGGRTVVYRHDPANPSSSIGSDAVLTLLEGRGNELWIGGWDAGVGVMDRATGRVVTYRHAPGSPYDNVFRLVADGPTGILVASAGGIERFDTGTRRFSAVPIVGGAITGTQYTMARDETGALWVAGSGGLRKLDPGGRLVVTPDGLPGSAALTLLEDSRRNLWIGYENDGLFCIPAGGGKVRSWTTRDGLPDDGIKDVLEDARGNLWVSTGRGLSRLEAAVTLPPQVRLTNFDVADGLQGKEFKYGTAFRSPAGELFFGGQKGLNRFFPERIVANPQPPPVVLTGLKLFNAAQPVGEPGSPLARALSELDELPLSHEQSVVTFEFAALNYVLPRKNRYAYRLEPLEAKWNEVGQQNAATYTLSPGSYVFRVKAANNDGLWNEQGVTLAVRVRQPWYWTWWARFIYVAAIAAALAGGYRVRVRRLAARQDELEATVSARTAELAASAESLRAQSEQLARENEERRRAEEDARRAAEEIAAAKQSIEQANLSLEQNRAGLEREVAERKRAEEAAGLERDLLHALMDNTPDLIYFKDAQSRFTRVNRAHAAALGLASPAGAVGRTDLDFFPAEFARLTLEDERKLLRSGQPLLGKLEHDAKNGRWFLGTKVPLRDEAGAVTGLVGISKDITERKLAEDRLERELAEFLGVVREVSRGDLTRRGTAGEGVLGRIACDFNAMLDAVAEILVEVRDTTLAVSTSSTEILAAATQIARGSQHGSEQVQQTSAAVEEMAASMVQVSRDADASADVARSALEHVREGESSVNAAYEGMTRIDNAVGETAEKMKLLDRRSRQIFDVIELIQEIAAQSELLALNAAIQAAHAGEAGRGFAVVADEIRRLAERSKEASRDVSEIVEGIVEEVRTVLAAMRLAMGEVKAERGLSEQARASLQEIEALVAESSQLAQQISGASREQAQATQTVSTSMQAIATVTTQSAAGAGETSRAVEHLVRLSDQLTAALERFRLGR